jgi:hypothetical protein
LKICIFKLTYLNLNILKINTLKWTFWNWTFSETFSSWYAHYKVTWPSHDILNSRDQSTHFG